MEATPRVTVLMTLYDKGPWVEEAVRSVLEQTFTDFELLVVDDASTDDGPARVKAIADPRIRVLEAAANTGRAAAANRGYDAARGAYVAVLDADDVMLPERLARQVAFLDAHPEVGAVGCWLRGFGQSERRIAPPADDGGARAIMLFGMPVIYPGCMLRRTVLEEHGLRCDPQWRLPGMDYLFMLRIGQRTRYANLQEVLTLYRTGEQNMRHGRDAVKDTIALNQGAFRLLGLPAAPRDAAAHAFLQDNLPGHLPTAVQLPAVAAWIRRLKALNRLLGLAPAAGLEAELQRRWDGLFHRLVRKDAAAALVHMALSGTWRTRAGYWAKFTKDRWMGSGPR